MSLLKNWVWGGITGLLVGVTFILVHEALTEDDRFKAWEFALATVTPCLVAIVMSKLTGCRKIVLISVAYLTLIMPILGLAFGVSGTEPLWLFTGLGLIGGLVWGTPIALWTYIIKRKRA